VTVAIIRQSSDPESAESSVAYRMRVFGHDHSGLTPGMSDQDKSMPGMSRQEGSPREMEAARIAAQNMVMLDKLKNTITDTYDTICEDNAADVTTLDAQAASKQQRHPRQGNGLRRTQRRCPLPHRTRRSAES
jgi:hypothetical protein